MSNYSIVASTCSRHQIEDQSAHETSSHRKQSASSYGASITEAPFNVSATEAPTTHSTKFSNNLPEERISDHQGKGEQEEQPRFAANMGPRQLIVNYLSPRVTDMELRMIFEEFGEVERARTNYNFKTGSSRGYAFVYFIRPQDAAEAVKKLDGFDLYGKHIRVGFANPQRPESEIQQTTKLRPPYQGPKKGKGE